jgi:60 kDa SS-A/Ro ribonucleoprotein
VNQDVIRKSRLHPLALLVALRTYASGQGFRGTNTWVPKPDVIDALDEAFYLAFDNVEATGKSHLLALDVSGSMGSGQVAGSPLTPREASAALALVTLHAEKNVEVVGFSSANGWNSPNGAGPRYRTMGHDGLTPLPLSRRQRLDDAVRAISDIPFGGTDCALPMLYATEKNLNIDAFVILTDSETWAGQVHPQQALAQYRANGHANARSVVVGMVSSGFSIADPTDPGTLDVAGFDTATPNLIAEFISGHI